MNRDPKGRAFGFVCLIVAMVGLFQADPRRPAGFAHIPVAEWVAALAFGFGLFFLTGSYRRLAAPARSRKGGTLVALSWGFAGLAWAVAVPLVAMGLPTVLLGCALAPTLLAGYLTRARSSQPEP
ncbi:MAG: hypothetical protein SNJ74_07750 [Fimbriimonadaceae bacterium]